MAELPVQRLTLREQFTNSERLTRELIEHLEQGFIPRVHNLRRLSRISKMSPDSEKVEDITIRNSAASVLDGEQFANQLYKKLAEYLSAIDDSVTRIVNEGQ